MIKKKNNLCGEEGVEVGRVTIDEITPDVTEPSCPDELYHLLTEYATDLISLNTIDGRRVWSSRSLERLRGPVTNIFENAHPHELKTILRWWKRILDGSTERHRWRVRTVAGEWRWLETATGLLTYQHRPYVLCTARDVTEQKLAEDLLRAKSKQIREMAAHLVEVEEAERRKLSQELHDRIGQILTALSINLNTIRRQITGDLREKIVPRINDSLSLTEEAVSRIKDVMADLRPPVLDDYGLLATLRWYGKQFASRTGIAVKIQGKEISPRPASNIEIALFRITQEAFTNISKHAKATKVTVILTNDKDSLCLSICDDGVGFHHSEKAEKDKRRGWGLLTMTERAESLGGEFRIEPRPKQGTRVVVKVPR